MEIRWDKKQQLINKQQNALETVARLQQLSFSYRHLQYFSSFLSKNSHLNLEL